MVENINNDFLSQFYSQSIERITRTKDHIFNFRIPKKLLKVRKISWVNLFGKYSKEMSDDIVLNVDTLEPDEEEIEKEVCEEEYACEQRIPMRKPATLVQYWINTGNQPYKALLDENELSDTGESLSEKDITLSLHSSVSTIINEGKKLKYKNIELCSMSKEYIASKTCDQPTTNIVTSDNTIQPNICSQSCQQTDKMNVLSISERSLDIQSKDDNIQQFNETLEQLTGDDENNGASNQERDKKKLEKNTSYREGVSENIAQEMITNDTSLTASYRKKLYTGRNSPIDLIQTEKHSINKVSGAMQSLHPALDSDCIIKRKTLLVHKDESENLSSSSKTNLGSKKMKRKRKKCSISNKIITDTNKESLNNNNTQNYIDSSFKISLDDTNSDKRDDVLLLEHNNANIFVMTETCKQDLSSLNINPVVLLDRIVPSFKRHKSKSAENNHIAQKSNVCNYKHLNKSNKLYTCNIENVELETIDSDESTILVCQCKTASYSKESDCSFNLRLSTEDDFSVSNTEEKNDKLSSLKNIDVSQNKEEPYIILEELSPRLSVNKDCTNVKSREIDAIVERLPSVIEPQIFNEDYTIQQQDVLNKSKTFSSNSHGTNKIDNVKSREIKIILERLPASVNKDSTNTTMETEIMNKNNIQQKEILNKFKRHSSNPYGINKTDNVKFRELKITLERLPSNICRNGTNIFADKNIISKNTNLHNNKRKRQIRKISKISACENVETSIRTVDKVDNNYSFRLRTRIKKYNDSKISDTSDIVVDHQVFDKIDSEFPIQYKNDSKVSQANHNTYSVLTFTSSDEDDFVRLIQRPKKRSKFTKDDEILNETDITEKNLCNEAKLVATHKDKYHCRNLRTVIFSSKKPKTTRETFESIKERKDSNGIEIKSSDNTITSLKMYENEKFVFTPNENDNDSIAKNLYKRKKRTSFLNYNKNISNSNERHLNAIGKRNGIDYKNDSCGMLFQTKIFYSDSSDSEENNSYITPICKTHKNSFMHHKLQYHNHDNLEKIFNDSKRYSRKHSSSLNSSFKKHEVTNQIHNIEIELGSTSKEAKISKRLDNEEFNDKINSRIINIKKDTSPCFINDISIRDTTMQKNIYSNISLGKNNSSSLSKNEQISDESKNASAIQQDDVKSTKLLMFQTKTYYGSDSNDSS
ncbi:putative leucine-rich repeat-containing protein DDB_G0290503 isoform X2 [Polyergus mexicanus]|uniref:putative leucine-rich repeat-containing protein DDB_G0290503 isoform X2 n=1 Tax=Polyergus mexicanus TaxID=615972 RepID=UPI0038B47C9C